MSLIFISLKQNTSLLIEAQLKHGGNRTPELAAPTEGGGACYSRMGRRQTSQLASCDQSRPHFSLQTQGLPSGLPTLPSALATGRGDWEDEGGGWPPTPVPSSLTTKYSPSRRAAGLPVLSCWSTYSRVNLGPAPLPHPASVPHSLSPTECPGCHNHPGHGLPVLSWVRE